MATAATRLLLACAFLDAFAGTILCLAIGQRFEARSFFLGGRNRFFAHIGTFFAAEAGFLGAGEDVFEDLYFLSVFGVGHLHRRNGLFGRSLAAAR